MDKPIYVTRPFLPPFADYTALLAQVWETGILSNFGAMHQSLEAKLSTFLDAPHLSLVANGMLALELALDAAGLDGEIITTPYSFAATTHAVRRGRLAPVFADLEPGGFNIDPRAITAAITPRTSAIVAVHCYGMPCDVAAIEAIATRHGLRVIYDAAHAFGVRLNGTSVFAHGDLSSLSFHATKAFSTIEGGAVISASAADAAAVRSARNFGIASETSIPAVGTNAKLSEPHAAFGLLQLQDYGTIRAGRERVDTLYRRLLADVAGLTVPPIPAGVEANYSYFPVLVDSDFPMPRDDLYEALKRHQIFSRRYFYPLLSNLDMYRPLPSTARANLPNANDVVERILCLPIYPDLADGDVERIVAAIVAIARGA